MLTSAVDAARRRLGALVRSKAGPPALPAPRFEPFPSMHTPILARADALAADGAPIAEVLAVLRALPFDDFGQLMFQMPDAAHPGLSRLLPRMAPQDVQEKWTGLHGVELLRRSTVFARSLRHAFLTFTGAPLDGACILDFGCGYGRMLRLMLHVTDPDRLCGVDAWEDSLRQCREAGLPNPLALSEAVPGALPFSESPFDLIFAHSVFTHLSPTAAHACLDAMGRAVAPDGLVAITFRPVEFWAFRERARHAPLSPGRAKELRRQHAREGIAHLPRRSRPGADEDAHYGHTSMSLDHLRRLPGWDLAAVDRHVQEPYQPVAFLRPVQDSPS